MSQRKQRPVELSCVTQYTLYDINTHRKAVFMRLLTNINDNIFRQTAMKRTKIINAVYNKRGGQFNECLLLWQPSGMFLYSTVTILISFMLWWKIKYDVDDDDIVYVDNDKLTVWPSMTVVA